MGSDESTGDAGAGATRPLASEEEVRRLRRQLREAETELQEREKELACLFAVAQALRRVDEDRDGALQNVVDALPGAFRWPRRMAARLQVGADSFRTAGHRPSPWRLTHPLQLQGTSLGLLEVCFVREPPPWQDAPDTDPAPFLPQEKRLLGEVADRVASALCQRELEVGPSRPDRPPTVLVVDDTPPVREVARRSLDRAGYSTLVADNGKDALEMITSGAHTIDLVVSDVVMPQMGGATLLARLAELQPALPVILTSGHSDGELPAEVRNRAAAFLEKPFGPRELVRLVRDTLAARSKSS